MAVVDIMTRNIVSVRPTDTIDTMCKMLDTHPIHHLLVMEDAKLLGVISDRDILKVLSPYLNTQVESSKDKLTLTRTANQIMSKELVCIKGNASIQQAAKKFVDSNVSLLPVIDQDEVTIGVLSWKDVLRFIS